MKYLLLARYNAELFSKDPKTKVGCIIVDQHYRVKTIGYNGPAAGLLDTEERLTTRKDLFMIHAELNAILNYESSLENCILYTTLFPCTECTDAIIQKRIKKIITFEPSKHHSIKYNFDVTREKLKEIGIEIIEYPVDIFDNIN